MIRIVAAVLLVLAFCGSAQASTAQCLANRPGVSISFGVTLGDKFSESDQNEFNLMRLRRMGVDATRAEMWGGCIRAFVRTPSGEEMQFFHPQSFERVYM
ncbi:hypothetical protein [Devosia marina]|uniref:Uncharacterized protein n=1 Tax=Devosia marina TaxID=2683198 RepID=A0A7X3FUX7_9HYPH|nr:hypothetical protein [Devosia marina]MVT00411.1 hypothetical protein [Devosia marina]